MWSGPDGVVRVVAEPVENFGSLAEVVRSLPAAGRDELAEKLLEISFAVCELIDLQPSDPQVEMEFAERSIPADVRRSVDWSALVANPGAVNDLVELRWRLDVIVAMEAALSESPARG